MRAPIDWRGRLVHAIGRDRVRLDEPMAGHTSMRVGGPAEALVDAASAQEVAVVVRVAADARVPLTVLGGGTNTIVRDGGIRGIVLRLGGPLRALTPDAQGITAGAGAPLTEAAKLAYGQSLGGLEFAVDIPGTVGGATVMNAGAYGGEIASVFRACTVVDGAGQLRVLSREELGFGYRATRLLGTSTIVLSTSFDLHAASSEDIERRMEENRRRRRATQPTSQPSAGSVFKRPPGHFAGRLIEDAGLKGRVHGKAQVSDLHAGFVVNAGGASAADVIELIQLVKDAVLEKTGVRLEEEVRIIGEERAA